MPAGDFKYFNYNKMSRPVKRYELIEQIIPANSTGTKFDFPDIPQLRDDTDQEIVIRGIEVFSVENMPLSPNGNAVSTTAQLLNTFLVLYIDNEESVKWIPLIRLQHVFQALATGTSQQTFEEFAFDDVKVNWNKSYLWAAAPYSGGTFTQFSVILGVEYKKFLPGTLKKRVLGFDNIQ